MSNSVSKTTPETATPTNIITGFLGVGKTTAIRYLLQQKPADERWAVLVNEFGEVGIDGSFLENSSTEGESDVFIREVPGGCMCCAAGLPMQIAVNQLLAKAKPDRLIIEPTGLGHPKEIIDVLTAAHYRSVIKLQATITLVDARKINDERYTSHDIFNQQLQVADIIAANKSDLYEPEDFQKLADFLEQTDRQTKMYKIEHGKLNPSWLEQHSKTNTQHSDHNHDDHNHDHDHDHDHQHNHPTSAWEPVQLPNTGYIKVSNQGEGFFSCGWIFDSRFVFDRQQLFQLFHDISAERMKGSFRTQEVPYGYNQVDGAVTEITLEDTSDSRVEAIVSDRASLAQLGNKIGSCLIEGAFDPEPD